MTLNRVIVDLGKSFEEGQEYVALSRYVEIQHSVAGEALALTPLGLEREA